MLSEYPLFDSHMHIIDKRFPLIPDNGYLPPEFDCKEYLTRMASYQLCGGVVVSGSFQAFDQSYLIAALKNLGESFVAAALKSLYLANPAALMFGSDLPFNQSIALLCK